MPGTENRDDRYAPPGTLLGLLQRGRGEGAIRAAADPATAADLVHACLRREWRWDSTVDERALYLARLIRDLELPIGPVAEMAAGDGDGEARERAAAVLALLADPAGPSEAQEPWEEYEDWAPPPQQPNPLAELPNRALLDLLADPAEEEHRKVDALKALYDRAPEPGLVPLVPGLGEAGGEHSLPMLGLVLHKLGALAMPAARAWAASGTRWLARQGHVVLYAHGQEQDIPVLLAELERDWTDRTWCGPANTARGLGRLGPAAADAIPLLRRFWWCTPHSYERHSYLEALEAMGAEGMAEAYTESLWDCQREARRLAVRRAPDEPHVRERLAYLRDDPMEEPEVRSAASVRLAGLS